MEKKLEKCMEYFTLILSYNHEERLKDNFTNILNKAVNKMLAAIYIDNISGGCNQYYFNKYNKMVREWEKSEIEKYNKSALMSL